MQKKKAENKKSDVEESKEFAKKTPIKTKTQKNYHVTILKSD
jgi:hypothetical protein